MNVRSENGMTIVELMIAISIFAVLSSAAYSMLIAQAKGAQATRSLAEVSDNARLGFNRMIRDVREADWISNVSLGTPPNTSTAFTIKVNFDGNTTYSTGEILTYAYASTTSTVTLCQSTAAGVCSGTPETLMTGVSPVSGSKAFDYSSNNLDWDWGGDGLTSWADIDSASAPAHGVTGVGNNDGALNAAEFPYLTKVSFALQINDGSVSNRFFETAQLRNRV